MVGRWNTKVQNETSNTVSYKIDKRGQIAHTAISWVGVDQDSGNHGGVTGYICNEFVAYIYGYLGLTLGGVGTGVNDCFKSAPVADSQIGSLDFYGKIDDIGYIGHVHYGHVGIIVETHNAANDTSWGSIVDVNCPRGSRKIDAYPDTDPLSSVNIKPFSYGPDGHTTFELTALDAE